MSTADSCIFVQSCKKSTVLFCHKIFFCLISSIPQAAANDLLYLTIMYVYTGSEFHLLLYLSLSFIYSFRRSETLPADSISLCICLFGVCDILSVSISGFSIIHSIHQRITGLGHSIYQIVHHVVGVDFVVDKLLVEIRSLLESHALDEL